MATNSNAGRGRGAYGPTRRRGLRTVNGSGSNPGSLNGIPNIPSVQGTAMGTMDAIRQATQNGFVYQAQNPILQGTPPPAQRNIIGGGGGRGGSGGGGMAPPDLTPGYQAALDYMRSQSGDYLRNQGMIDALRDPSALDARVNAYIQNAQNANRQAVDQTNAAATQGNARLDQIVQALTGRLGQARSQVQDVFRGNAADLQNVASTAQGQLDGVASQVGQAAQGFGFTPSQDVGGVSDLAQALQAAASTRASAYDAAYADRSNVYGGLQADVSRNITDRQQALTAQATQALQQMLAEAGTRRMEGSQQLNQAGLAEQMRQQQQYEQWNQGNQQNIYQLMIQAAQNGAQVR
jgi:hypothetical protein